MKYKQSSNFRKKAQSIPHQYEKQSIQSFTNERCIFTPIKSNQLSNSINQTSIKEQQILSNLKE